MKCQAIIAGVGGQGVLFAARIFTELARSHQLPILGSQTFGMAQRGGSVMTHIKIGDFDSPLVAEGDADLLLALDLVEAHRRMPFLRRARNGERPVCVVNVPTGQAFPDPRLAGAVSEHDIAIHACDADAAAMEIPAPLAANLVLIGFGAARGAFPFSYDEVHAAVEDLSGTAHRAVNLKALARGDSMATTLRP